MDAPRVQQLVRRASVGAGEHRGVGAPVHPRNSTDGRGSAGAGKPRRDAQDELIGSDNRLTGAIPNTFLNLNMDGSNWAGSSWGNGADIRSWRGVTVAGPVPPHSVLARAIQRTSGTGSCRARRLCGRRPDRTWQRRPVRCGGCGDGPRGHAGRGGTRRGDPEARNTGTAGWRESPSPGPTVRRRWTRTTRGRSRS